MAINPKLLNSGETVLVDTRTHPKALVGPVLVFLVLLAAGIAFTVVVDNKIARIAAWVVVLVLLAWWVVPPVLRWLTATYTVTNRRLITRAGIFNRTGHDIPLARISDVRYEFGLLDRMLGCGTLIIGDASRDGELPLHDIPHVEETQRQLNELLQGVHHGETGVADGA